MLNFKNVTIQITPTFEIRLVDPEKGADSLVDVEMQPDARTSCSIFNVEHKDKWKDFFDIEDSADVQGMVACDHEWTLVYLFLSEDEIQKLMSAMSAIWNENSVINVFIMTGLKPHKSKGRDIYCVHISQVSVMTSGG